MSTPDQGNERKQPWWLEDRGPDHTPPPARGKGARRPFGTTWWGREWVSALENRAALDPNRLPRGRSYARRGTVRDLDVAPGLVRAKVQGSREKPYDVTIRVRTFSDADWDHVLSVVALQVGHTAALLDGELPPELTDDIASAGLDLLPGPGDLQPRCTCPDYADPCKHSAAVCFVIADALDADPFELLHLRGRTREEVMAGLRARRRGAVVPTALGAADSEPDKGIPARKAYDRTELPDVPIPPLPPDRPGRPRPLDVEPPAASGVTTAGLLALASDAARRAWELAMGVGDGGLSLTPEADLARRAADMMGARELVGLAERSGLPIRELTARAIAWREGGAGGVEVLLEPWKPAPEVLVDGRAALKRAQGEAPKVRLNRVTEGARQLRIGRDGLWYLFVRSGSTWDLAGPPSPIPDDLVV